MHIYVRNLFDLAFFMFCLNFVSIISIAFFFLFLFSFFSLSLSLSPALRSLSLSCSRFSLLPFFCYAPYFPSVSFPPYLSSHWLTTFLPRLYFPSLPPHLPHSFLTSPSGTIFIHLPSFSFLPIPSYPSPHRSSCKDLSLLDMREVKLFKLKEQMSSPLYSFFS
ncbi:unnamed protein product [Acanthosepion pharaonis]|uniref:Uncharacterized protein n=1 Tax=Acanthosepion pharaonis TaxID=158019 RepID=A0A812ASP7_ACAPH|nr:unnamed protein product [Sepia pharaonis]